MASLSEALYQARFRLAYSEKKGTAFEAWFAALAGHALRGDFEPVAAHGRDGDFKCDGRRLSTRTIFQCYAPDGMVQSRTIAKIDSDFQGALHHWPSWMREWTLVHNRPDGLPPRVVAHLDQLRGRNPSVAIHVWGLPRLQDELFSKLDVAGREAVFGFAPSTDEVDKLTFADIVPVIDSLQKEVSAADLPPIEPPSPRKLEKNALSEDVADFLRVGRRKEALVERYFRSHPKPDLGENIAVSFRRRYAELREHGLLPDDIFAELQQNAGANGPPKRQAAALAVLSYYFERCDIFEDPEEAQP